MRNGTRPMQVSIEVDCGAHGSCVNGSCVCESGAYSGDRCQNVDQCFGVQCGSHGDCVSGSCECKDRYTGSTCTQSPLQCCSTCAQHIDKCLELWTMQASTVRCHLRRRLRRRWRLRLRMLTRPTPIASAAAVTSVAATVKMAATVIVGAPVVCAHAGSFVAEKGCVQACLDEDNVLCIHKNNKHTNCCAVHPGKAWNCVGGTCVCESGA